MKIREFEQKIGYQFQNRDYLETALTHSSFNREKNTKHQDNERLEFLGDAFFDAVISVELFGSQGILYFGIAAAVSYRLSGYYGLYSEQKILYSKLRPEFIDQKVK